MVSRRSSRAAPRSPSSPACSAAAKPRPGARLEFSSSPQRAAANPACAGPMGAAMDIDFADLLMEVVARRASDLHISAGAHPTIRVRGRLIPLENYPKLSGADTREIIYSILTGDQRQRLQTNRQRDLAHP